MVFACYVLEVHYIALFTGATSLLVLQLAKLIVKIYVFLRKLLTVITEIINN